MFILLMNIINSVMLFVLSRYQKIYVIIAKMQCQICQMYYIKNSKFYNFSIYISNFHVRNDLIEIFPYFNKISL